MAPVRILVADDSVTIRTQLRRLLCEQGYEVQVAENGEEALRLIRDDCPQLLILDINMPGLDGYDVCAQLQQMGEPWNALPVVFLTSVDAHALDLLGEAMGAYLKKPATGDTLRSTVAKIIARRQTSVNPA
jgi:DNA-binding response OmpR family regulator